MGLPHDQCRCWGDLVRGPKHHTHDQKTWMGMDGHWAEPRLTDARWAPDRALQHLFRRVYDNDGDDPDWLRCLWGVFCVQPTRRSPGRFDTVLHPESRGP